MVRIKEHYQNTVREELSISSEVTSVFERPQIKGVTVHISLKPFNFNPYSVGPRLLAQELTLGSRSKTSVSRLSEQELGVRKGAVVGLYASKSNFASIYDFIDRTVWNIAGFQNQLFSG
jgi:ribosomal protein L5